MLLASGCALLFCSIAATAATSVDAKIASSSSELFSAEKNTVAQEGYVSTCEPNESFPRFPESPKVKQVVTSFSVYGGSTGGNVKFVHFGVKNTETGTYYAKPDQSNTFNVRLVNLNLTDSDDSCYIDVGLIAAGNAFPLTYTSDGEGRYGSVVSFFAYPLSRSPELIETANNRAVNLEFTREDDCDEDGFGDKTQDSKIELIKSPAYPCRNELPLSKITFSGKASTQSPSVKSLTQLASGLAKSGPKEYRVNAELRDLAATGVYEGGAQLKNNWSEEANKGRKLVAKAQLYLSEKQKKILRKAGGKRTAKLLRSSPIASAKSRTQYTLASSDSLTPNLVLKTSKRGRQLLKELLKQSKKLSSRGIKSMRFCVRTSSYDSKIGKEYVARSESCDLKLPIQ